jgi:hypothetical protein
MEDQKRYAVALQDDKDPSKYKDFFQTDNEKDAISNAKGSAQKNKRKTMIFDRIVNWIIHRFPEDNDTAIPEKKIKQEVVPEKKKRGRPKKVVEMKPPKKKK